MDVLYIFRPSRPAIRPSSSSSDVKHSPAAAGQSVSVPTIKVMYSASNKPTKPPPPRPTPPRPTPPRLSPTKQPPPAVPSKGPRGKVSIVKKLISTTFHLY